MLVLMPRSLRWLASITTGIITQFVFQILVLAIASHGGKVKVNPADAKIAFAGIIATVINLIMALAVNDWLAKRYPRVRPSEPTRTEESANAR